MDGDVYVRMVIAGISVRCRVGIAVSRMSRRDEEEKG